MAKNGRRPVGKVVLNLRGSWRGKAGDGASRGGAVQRRCPQAPSWLSPAAKGWWKKLAPEIHAREALTVLSAGLLTRYCVALVRWTEAQQYLQQHGVLYKTDAGYTCIHPYVKLAKDAGHELLRLELELGITPGARRSLGYVEGQRKEETPHGREQEATKHDKASFFS